MIRCYPVLSAASLLTVLLLSACKEAPPHLTVTPQPIIANNQLRFTAGHPQLALLQTAAAMDATDLSIELPAKLVWNEERTQRIYPAFSGRVSKINADIGHPVAVGSVLAQLSSPDFGMAQADAARAKANAELANKNLLRQRELFEAGIVARKELEQAQADADSASAELQRAQSRSGLYGGGFAVNQQLGLVANMAGVVVERNLNPGQELRADLNGPGVPPLFVVTDPTQLWAQIDARESDVLALRPGTKIKLLVPSLAGQSFDATVITSADAIDPITRTIKVRAHVPNSKRLLKSEMLATAQLLRSMAGAVVVPASAVFLRGTSNIVFIQSAPGVFEPRPVKLLYEGSKQVYVSEGVRAGESVVVQNGLLLERELRNAQEDAQQAPMVLPKAKP